MWTKTSSSGMASLCTSTRKDGADMDRDRSQEQQVEPFVPDRTKVPRHPEQGPLNLDAAELTRSRAGESSQQSHVEEVEQPAAERPSPAPRTPHRDRDRTYNLRESETLTLAHIGMFRAVRVRDLAEHLYAGDEGVASRDLRNLTAQGLIQRNTLQGKQTDTLVTLTPEARRLLEKNRPSSPTLTRLSTLDLSNPVRRSTTPTSTGCTRRRRSTCWPLERRTSVSFSTSSLRKPSTTNLPG